MLSVLLAFAVVPPVILFGLSYAIRPVFVARGVILSSLIYYVLLGWLLGRARVRVAATVLMVLTFVLGLGLVFQYTYNEFPRSPFRTADGYLRTNARADDVIVHDNKLSYFPMHYDDQGLVQAFLADPPDSDNDTLARGSMDAMQTYPTSLDAATLRAPRVWFIIFQRALDEAAGLGQMHTNLDWMDRHFTRVSLERFNDLNVYLYQN
jgi:mannosyltransferase